jgi:hypothetical protein
LLHGENDDATSIAVSARFVRFTEAAVAALREIDDTFAYHRHVSLDTCGESICVARRTLSLLDKEAK